MVRIKQLVQKSSVVDHHYLCTVSYIFVTHFYRTLYCRSLKSIDFIKALNKFRYLDTSSCLLAGQFPFLIVCCFRTSLCVWVFVQWNSRWSVVGSPWPQMHVASSRSLKRWRYALVFPCPDSMAARFGVRLIFVPVYVYVTMCMCEYMYIFVFAEWGHYFHIVMCVCVCVCVSVSFSLFRKTKNKQAFKISILSLCVCLCPPILASEPFNRFPRNLVWSFHDWRTEYSSSDNMAETRTCEVEATLLLLTLRPWNLVR
jgi:hypothetical protein